MIFNKPTQPQHFTTGNYQKHGHRITNKQGIIKRFAKLLSKGKRVFNKAHKTDCPLYRQHCYQILNSTQGHNLYYWPLKGLYELEVPLNNGFSSHKTKDIGLIAKWLYECGEAPDIQTAIYRLNNWGIV